MLPFHHSVKRSRWDRNRNHSGRWSGKQNIDTMEINTMRDATQQRLRATNSTDCLKICGSHSTERRVQQPTHDCISILLHTAHRVVTVVQQCNNCRLTCDYLYLFRSTDKSSPHELAPDDRRLPNSCCCCVGG